MKMNIEKLEDIAKVIAGQSPISSYYNDKEDGYPFLQGKTDFGKTYPKARTWCTKPKKLAERNDILLSVRAPVGAVNISNTDVCIGRGICAIRANEKCDYRYLYYYLKTHERQIQRYQTGSTFKSITVAKIKQLKIPIPESLDDQKKIANLLTKVEALIAKREESIVLLDALLRSSFLDMFGDPVLNSKGWDKKTCIDVASCLVPTRDKPKSFSGGIPWITTNNLIDKGRIKIDRDNYLGLSKEEMKQVKVRIIPKGSVIFTCVGDLGIVSINDEDIVMNQQLHSFQCFDEVNNIFMMFNISFQKRYMYKYASKTTVPYMNKTTCNKIPIILPPKPLQDKFATIVKQVESTKEQYQKSLDELCHLFGSLSQRAFRGELGLRDIDSEKSKLTIKINGKEIILDDKKEVSPLDFKLGLGSSIANISSYSTPKVQNIEVEIPKVGIDTSALSIGSKLVEGICKADGVVKLDALSKVTGFSSLVGKEYNALHDRLSSFGRVQISDIFPSISTNLTPSFITTEQLSNNLLENTLGLNTYAKGVDSSYFKTWRKQEENRLSDLISRPTLGLSSSELWSNKISDAIGISALSNLESVYGVTNAIETMDMWKHENDRLQAVQQIQVTDYQKEELERFQQLAGLGKYDEQIQNFTNEYKSLFEVPLNGFDIGLVQENKSLKEFNSRMENLSLKALEKSFEVTQSYKLALERAEAMNPLRGWGERHEALINRYSEKVEETTEVIESILNLTDLIHDELFDDIFWTDDYDKIKKLVYKLLDEGKLEQLFDKNEKRVVLRKVEQ